MLLERAEITVKKGMEEEFAKLMAERGLAILTKMPGCKRAKLGRGVENPNKFMLLVEWDSLDSHNAMRTHPAYPDFRAVLGPYTEAGAMEHFQMA